MRNFAIFFLLFLSIPLFAQDSVNIKIYRENAGNINFLYADNEEFAPVSVEYVFTANNLTSSLANKKIAVIPANSKKFLLTELKPIDPKKGTSFRYTVFYVLGDVRVSTEESKFIYNLPFAKNRTYLIYQGYNGNFSHQNNRSLDFSLKSGDEVHASREGKVVQVVTNNNKNCLSKACAKFNNKILILHKDGTLAEYLHLKMNGATVKVGQDVEIGQLIGYSGNTGWSKGPHLHFSVFTPKIDGERNYIKTKFKVEGNKNPVYLEAQKSYTRNN